VSTEQNKAVVRRFIESLNNLETINAALVDELFAPDYVNHLLPGGREAFKPLFPMLLSANPDFKIHYDIEHMVAEGEYVVVRFIYTVTNAGKEASGPVVSEYRVVNGKIVEDWPPSDMMAYLQQVGVSLPMGPA
jgi:predicted SnoaL-like aldol condensation-catalyzing enzyme